MPELDKGPYQLSAFPLVHGASKGLFIEPHVVSYLFQLFNLCMFSSVPKEVGALVGHRFWGKSYYAVPHVFSTSVKQLVKKDGLLI